MGYLVNKKDFIKKLPANMKVKFKFLDKFDESFFGEENSIKKGKIYSIKTSEDNIKKIPKDLNVKISGKNIDFIIDDLNFRFIISGKRAARKGDAKSTEYQELCSLKICENVYNNKPTELTQLTEIYKDLPESKDWQESFLAQEKIFKVIKQKYNFNPQVFNRDGGFMDFITKLVKKFGISQKDSWNPADIWLYNKGIEKEFDNIKSIYELNSKLLELFHAGKLLGISLKKTGKIAKVEEVNITDKSKITNSFISGKLLLDLKADGKEFSNDELSFDLTHPEGIINAQVRMYPKLPKSNVQISYKLKGGKAEFGKVSSIFRNEIYETLTGSKFPTGKLVPHNLEQYNKIKNKLKPKIEKIISKGIITTNIKTFDEFDKNITSIYNLNNEKYHQIELVTKFQGIELAYEMSKLKDDELIELVTKWSYISQKKGDMFGCFLKVY